MTLPDDDTLRQANWVWSNLRHELAEDDVTLPVLTLIGSKLRQRAA